MSVIYEPKGKAREYCELALNLYKGCSHGCAYCYAPAATRTTIADFRKVKPRKDIIARLEKDVATGAYKGKEVFLCFSCDPYPVGNDNRNTREAIKILHANGVKVRLLTKSGQRSEADFDILSFYGATLTFTNGLDSLKWEPEAALPSERFAALKKAHDLGIPTWASLEPVIDPVQTLDIIRITYEYVDTYKVGKWNYHKDAAKIDWKEFGFVAKILLAGLGKQYLFKKDLLKEMEG